MALRDTSWVLDTVGAFKDANANITNYAANKRYTSKVTLSGSTWTTQLLSQNITIVDREWICLTEAAAKNVVDAKAAFDVTAVEVNRILGEFKVVQHSQTRGDWDT